MVYLDKILHTYLCSNSPATGMQDGDEALPSITSANRGLLVKMLTITIVPSDQS